MEKSKTTATLVTSLNRVILTHHIEESLRSAKICVCVEQKLMFRARLPSIFVTSHKMPRLRNLHLVLTMRFANTRNTTRLKGCLHLPRKMKMDPSKVPRLPGKLELIFSKRRKSFAPATQSDFRYVTKHQEVPHLPRETKQRDV